MNNVADGVTVISVERQFAPHDDDQRVAGMQISGCGRSVVLPAGSRDCRVARFNSSSMVVSRLCCDRVMICSGR